MTHTISTLTLIGTFLLLAGCGGGGEADAEEAVRAAITGSASSEGSAPIAACEMIRVEEVQALLQDEIREPSDTFRPGGVTLGECTWRADNNGRSLHLAVWSTSLWDQRIEFDGGAAGAIEGVGARGMRTQDGRVLIEPDHGNYFVTALVIDTDGSMNTDLATSAAGLAID